MDRVFIDTNVLVDWLTQRSPFAEHSTKIVELNAVKEDMGDFEDEVHLQSMTANGIQVVITRNKKDFAYQSIRAFTPVEYLESLRNADEV
jgi:predicted nucleic acid-binding protein